MKKIKMARGVALTFEEGCNKYLENCRQRNLREGTVIKRCGFINDDTSGRYKLSLCAESRFS